MRSSELRLQLPLAVPYSRLRTTALHPFVSNDTDAGEEWNLLRSSDHFVALYTYYINNIYSKTVAGHFIPTKWEGNGGTDKQGFLCKFIQLKEDLTQPWGRSWPKVSLCFIVLQYRLYFYTRCFWFYWGKETRQHYT